MKHYLFLYLFVCLSYFVYSQSNNEIKVVDSLLSVNNKTSNEKKYILDQAIAFAKSQKLQYDEFRYEILKGEILFNEGEYFESIELLLNTEKRIEKKIQASNDEKYWKDLHIDALSQLGGSQAYFRLYEMGMNSYKKIIYLYGEDSLSIATGRAYNGFGVLFSLQNYAQEALKCFNKSYKIFKLHNYEKGIFAILSNLGSINLELKNYNDALSYFLEAQRYLLSQKQEDKKIIYINYYIGVAYQKLMKWDLAEKYYSEAKIHGLRQNNNHLNLYTDKNTAILLFEQGRYQESKVLSSKVLEDAKKMKSYEIQGNMLHQLSIIAEKEGDYKACSKYLQTEIEVLNEMNSNESVNKVASMKYEFENYKKMQAGKVKNIELELTKALLIKRNLWIVVLFIISIFAIFAIVFLIKKIYNVKVKTRETISDIQEENKSNSKIIEFKNKELTSNTLLFLKFNELNSILMQKIKELKFQFSLKGGEKKVVLEMESILKQFTPDKSWNEFKIYFEQVNSDFFTKLDQGYPQLTPNEKRLCALIYLNLNAKEIASLTNRSFQSVNTARHRLKKKLNLDPHANFSDFFQNL